MNMATLKIVIGREQITPQGDGNCLTVYRLKKNKKNGEENR